MRGTVSQDASRRLHQIQNEGDVEFHQLLNSEDEVFNISHANRDFKDKKWVIGVDYLRLSFFLPVKPSLLDDRKYHFTVRIRSCERRSAIMYVEKVNDEWNYSKFSGYRHYPNITAKDATGTMMSQEDL